MRLGVLLALAACGSTAPTARPTNPTPATAAPAAALLLDELPGMWLDQVGIEGIDDEHVDAAVRSRRGERADLARIRVDILAIYATGMVQDVRAEAWRQGTGAALRYRVEPRPRTRSITFRGNDHLSDAVLRAGLTSIDRPVVSPSIVKRDADRIAAVYRERGYLDAAVRPTVRDGAISFEITEGPLVSVGSISFTGNRAVSAADLAALLVGVPGENSVGGRYDADALREREPFVLAHYHDRGYVDARVGEPTVTRAPDRRTVAITVPISEGRQFRLGTLTTTGTLVASAATYLRTLGVKPGAVFNRTALYTGVEAVRVLHARYASVPITLVEVVPKTTIHQDTRRIDISLHIGTVTPSGTAPPPRP
jgi:outer membrane protein insertion porin family